jgi:hypothetical protein
VAKVLGIQGFDWAEEHTKTGDLESHRTSRKKPNGISTCSIQFAISLTYSILTNNSEGFFSIPELLDGQTRLQLILRPLQMLHA